MRSVLHSCADFFQLGCQELVRYASRYTNDAQLPGLPMEVGNNCAVLLNENLVLCNDEVLCRFITEQ